MAIRVMESPNTVQRKHYGMHISTSLMSTSLPVQLVLHLQIRRMGIGLQYVLRHASCDTFIYEIGKPYNYIIVIQLSMDCRISGLIMIG